jgi:hypothetical protein
MNLEEWYSKLHFANSGICLSTEQCKELTELLYEFRDLLWALSRIEAVRDKQHKANRP